VGFNSGERREHTNAGDWGAVFQHNDPPKLDTLDKLEANFGVRLGAFPRI